MFNKKDYQAAFSQVRASEDTFQEVLNMANRRNKRKSISLRRAVVLVAAVIALMAVTVTAFASEYVQKWFVNHFSDNGNAPLSTEQIEFIEENEQLIDQSQFCDGYTLELKSAISDGEKAYICIGITAPEDVVLNATTIAGYSPDAPSLRPENYAQDFLTDRSGGNFLGYSSIASVEDNDGLSNTQNLVIELTFDTTHSEEDAVWKLRFENLIAHYRNEAYMRELMQGKYKDQDNFFFTEEESKSLNPKVTLAEGVWEFEIRFDEPAIREVELIDEPVNTRACDESGESRNVNIISFILRSLSATIYTNDQTSSTFFDYGVDVYVVMKDGSMIRLLGESGMPGEQQLAAETPIILSEVDHILLGDGTIIPMPELEME